MTITPVEILPHDLAVKTALETIGKPVGFSEAPAGALDALRAGTGEDYIILDPISGLRQPTSAKDSEGDAVLVYQTRIVAQLPEGARDLIALVETALRVVEIPDRIVVRVTADEIGQVRPDNNDQVKPTVFLATPRWRLWTTPTA